MIAADDAVQSMEGPARDVEARPDAFMMPEWAASRLNRASVVPLSIGLLLAIGVGDYATGVDITFTLLYVLPVSLAAWFRSRWFGFAIAAAAVVSGVVSTLASHDRHLGWPTVVWNQMGALGVFALIVWLLDNLRSYVEEEKRKHGLTVTQLRHAERLNVIGTLAAGVAHELGTPLNVITANAELIESGQLSPEKVHRALQAIRRQSARMAEIIAHLLEFGRRGGSSKAVVNLGTLVTKACSLLQPIADRATCTIVRPNPPVEVIAIVNPGEIEQVLANLILNAIQAMPDGGTVRVGCDVEPRKDASHSFARLTVQDEGSGISAVDLPKIFDPFFTTKGVGKGTGLGLAVTYGIVQDHRGTITVDTSSRGSRFVVRLPVTE